MNKPPERNVFREVAPNLLAAGFTPIPVSPYTKAPAVYAGRIMEADIYYRRRLPKGVEVGDLYYKNLAGWDALSVEAYQNERKYSYEAWLRAPSGGVGVLCGNGLHHTGH